MSRKIEITILFAVTLGLLCGSAYTENTNKQTFVSAPSGHIILDSNFSPLLTVHANLQSDVHTGYEQEGGNYSAESEAVSNGETQETNIESDPEKIFLGTYRISHYCPCRTCNGGYTGTASGAPLQPGVTVAVDKRQIALGSTLYIEGYGERVAQDTGGAIKGDRIDICVGTHSEAYELGVVYRDVWLIK